MLHCGRFLLYLVSNMDSQPLGCASPLPDLQIVQERLAEFLPISSRVPPSEVFSRVPPFTSRSAHQSPLRPSGGGVASPESPRPFGGLLCQALYPIIELLSTVPSPYIQECSAESPLRQQSRSGEAGQVGTEEVCWWSYCPTTVEGRG